MHEYKDMEQELKRRLLAFIGNTPETEPNRRERAWLIDRLREETGTTGVILSDAELENRYQSQELERFLGMNEN